MRSSSADGASAHRYTAAERDNVPAVAQAVDALIPEACPPCLAVGERIAEQCSDVSGIAWSHERKCYPS